ncbi:MAG: PEP-CTERM sorting domain-containing protein [Fimbriimonadaceae bacterium]|nr:PEP-CTERM sorting domain-containing protein [Fimbriimonadaceae bacterium]
MLLVCVSFAAVSQAAFDLWAIDYDSGDLYAFDPGNVVGGVVTNDIVGSTGVTGWACLEYNRSDRFLYGFTTGSTAALYRIDPQNARATQIGALNVGFVFEGSLVFAPDGTAYGTNAGTAQAPSFFTVNLTTGAGTMVSTIGGLAHDVNGTAWRPDGKIAGIDRVTNNLLIYNPANGFISDQLGVTPVLGEVGGMAVLRGQAYLSTSGPGGVFPADNKLYKLNLETGATVEVGTLAALGGTGFSGLAAVPEPATILFLVGGLAGLAARKRR